MRSWFHPSTRTLTRLLLSGEEAMAFDEEIPKLVEKLQNLLAHPQEDLEVEFKNWLKLSDEEDKANLAQALLAIANHGGGHVVIGYSRSPTGLKPDTNRPTNLNLYSADEVNNIVKRYAEPRFQCRVDLVRHPVTGDLFPIITVPGGHRVPIRAKSETQTRKHVRVNTYYIRRPGPESSEPQTGQEWDDLMRRCVTNSREHLLHQMRYVLEGFGPTAFGMSAGQEDDEEFREWIESGVERFREWGKEALRSETFSLAESNYWTGAYRIHQDLAMADAQQLLGKLQKVQRREPGGPYWYVPAGDQGSDPWYANGMIEMGYEPMRSNLFETGLPFEFWRASPQGLIFLLRGYDEDFPSSEEQPQMRLRAENPIWDVAACCCHAARLAKALDAGSAEITLGFSWEGLRDRRLIAVKERVSKERISRQPKASSRIRCSVEKIETNLPELVRNFTAELYQGFSFFQPPMSFIEEHISKLKSLTPGILETQ